MNTKHVSPERIMQIATGHWSLKALAVAVDLSIFTSLKGKENIGVTSSFLKKT
jgi:hypothetical protein